MAAGGLCGKTRHNNRLFRGEGQAVSLRNTDRSFDVQVGSNRSDRSTPLFGRNPCSGKKIPCSRQNRELPATHWNCCTN